MRRLGVLLAAGLSLSLMSFTWQTDFEKAKAKAKSEHKLILLKFSGSDWCLPCIRMEKEVFSNQSFSQFSDKNLEMVNADFPRLSKHKLDKSVSKQNEALAERYNKDGHFPLTLLLDADGKVLKVWDGYQGQKPEDLIGEIKQNANR